MKKRRKYSCFSVKVMASVFLLMMIVVSFFLMSSKADPGSDDLATLGNVGEMLDGDHAYITQVSMVENENTTSKKAIVTGSEPFDIDEYGTNITADLLPGDDNTPNNHIVRTFDLVDYTINFNTGMQKDADLIAYKNGKIYFELVLPYGSEQAIFITERMGWLESRTDVYYKIMEFDHKSEDGTISKWQVLKGSYTLVPSTDNPTAIGSSYRELTLSIRVLNMKNKDTVQPYFTFWLQGNDVFDGNDFDAAIKKWYEDDSLVTFSENRCHTHKNTDGQGIQEYQTVIPPLVVVTGVPRYNVKLTSGASSQNQKLGTFDFSMGNDFAQNKDKGVVTGRVGGYGVAIQLLGKTAAHGLRGVEIPSGEAITFDLQLSSKYGGKDVMENYTPLFYSIDQNASGNTQRDGRTLSTSSKQVTSLPYNKNGNFNSCYNGGTWEYVVEGNVAHITVRDYVVNLSRLPYTSTSGNTISYTYYNPKQISNYWEIQTAYISAGEVWVVQPFYNSNSSSSNYQKYVSDELGKGSFVVTLSDRNLVMKSASQQTLTTQVTTTDDSTNQTFSLEKSGSFSGSLVFVKYNLINYNDALTDGAWSNGKDTQVLGGRLKIESWISHDDAEGLNNGVAYDILIKYDDVFFEPDGTVSNGNVNRTVSKTIWGAKKDKTGWNHRGLKPDADGYDQEMINATVDDLIFFDSLEELKKQGYVPVATLLERRGLSSEGMSHLHSYIGGSVKKDCPTNYVYMSTYTVRAWKKNDIKDLVAAANGITITSQNDYGKITNDMYDAYAKTKMPSRSGSANVTYDAYPNATYIHTAKTQPKTLGAYQKAKYNENGYASGSTGTSSGDSCYVAGYFMNVAMKTAQSGANADGSKRVYDMDESQRTVDFVIEPSVTSSIPASSSVRVNTTVTVEATLGAGFTYIEGSSHLGGTYTESKRGQGVISGDTVSISPSVTKNEDGTTTLKWTLYDVNFTLDQKVSLDKIYYSCQIGDLSREENDVKHGTEISATVKIKSSEDYARDFSVANHNISAVSILIQKNNAISLSNMADKISNELSSNYGFLMSYGNNTSSIASTILVNGLPYNGDGISSFHGNLKVTELSVGSVQTEHHNAVLDHFTFYYTTNTNYRGKTSSELKDENFLNSSVWKKLEIGDRDGNQNRPDLARAPLVIPSNFSPTLIVAVGELPAQMALQMHITYQLPDGKPGDYIGNFLTQARHEAYSYSYIVSRMLEGRVWIDSDYNGVHGLKEEELSNVQVTLMKLKDSGNKENMKDYEPYVITVSGKKQGVTLTTGHQFDVLTGSITNYERTFPSSGTATSSENGSYRFYNLPAGVYGVRLESNDQVSLLDYDLSFKNQGSNHEIDSDGDANYDEDYELNEIFIPGITLSSIENINVRYYESRFHDVGVYPVYQFSYRVVKKESLSVGVGGTDFSLYKLVCDHPEHTEEDHDQMLIDPTNVSPCFEFVSEATSSSKGTVQIRRLAKGLQYRLVETKASFNRVLPMGQWKVIFDGDNYSIQTLGAKETPNFIDRNGMFLLPNKAILYLPFTGGKGVYLYYLLGTLFVTSGIVLYVIHKKKQDHMEDEVI